MEKLNTPGKVYHAFLLFPLSMFSAFSFSPAIAGIFSDENDKPVVVATLTVNHLKEGKQA